MHNFVESLLASLVIRPAQAHFGVVDYRRENVVELMRNRRRDRADRAQFLGLQQLFVERFNLLLKFFNRWFNCHCGSVWVGALDGGGSVGSLWNHL